MISSNEPIGVIILLKDAITLPENPLVKIIPVILYPFQSNLEI